MTGNFSYSENVYFEYEKIKIIKKSFLSLPLVCKYFRLEFQFNFFLEESYFFADYFNKIKIFDRFYIKLIL